MRSFLVVSMAWGCFAALGCSSGNGQFPVQGLVTFNGQPLEKAAITFIPEEGTFGAGGFAGTLPGGHYQLVNPQGLKGVFPGKYRVTISAGEVPQITNPDDAVLIEKMRKETMPPRYSDPERTELTATVEPRSNTINFDLTAQPGQR